MKHGQMFWTKKTLIAAGPLLVVGLLALGLWHDLFHSTVWYDLFMHVLGGGVVALSGVGLAWHVWLKRRGAAPGLLLKAAMVGLVLLVAVLWEVWEVLYEMTPNWTLSVSDTISDVLSGVAGAILVLRLVHGR